MGFDFITFAREVYSDSPKTYPVPISLRARANAGLDLTLDRQHVATAMEERFLRPALYGGETHNEQAGESFEALVVLEAPSVPFTRREWKNYEVPCASPEEAVSRRRKIFFKWAFGEQRQAELFGGLLGGKPATEVEFFQRLYITDIWKDPALTNERSHLRYWQSKLEEEIRGTPTRDVVFLGESAHRYGEPSLARGSKLSAATELEMPRSSRWRT